VRDVGVGDVYLIAGQSNPMGAGGVVVVPSYDPPTAAPSPPSGLRASVLYLNGHARELRDPIASEVGKVTPLPNNGNSPNASYLARVTTPLLVRLKTVPIMWVPCAQGGSSFEQWAPSEDPVDLTTLHGTAVLRGRLAGVRAVYFHDGETNALGSDDQATMSAALIAIARAFGERLAHPVTGPCAFIPVKIQKALTGSIYSYSDARQAIVNAAVQDAWDAGGNILGGVDLSLLTTDVAGPEFKSAAALQGVADVVAPALLTILYP